MILQVSVCAHGGGGGYPRGGEGLVETHPLLLAPSGGYQNMYGWQVGGTHPTEHQN